MKKDDSIVKSFRVPNGKRVTMCFDKDKVEFKEDNGNLTSVKAYNVSLCVGDSDKKNFDLLNKVSAYEMNCVETGGSTIVYLAAALKVLLNFIKKHPTRNVVIFGANDKRTSAYRYVMRYGFKKIVSTDNRIGYLYIAKENM